MGSGLAVFGLGIFAGLIVLFLLTNTWVLRKRSVGQQHNMKELAERLERVDKALGELRVSTTENLELSDKKTTNIGNELKSIKESLKDLTASNTSVSDQVAALGQRAGVADERVAEVSDQVAALGDPLSTSNKRMDDVNKQVVALGERTKALDERVGEIKDRTGALLATEAVFSESVHFSRGLDAKDIEQLVKVWTRTLNVSASRTELIYRAKQVIELERRSRGRMATALVDALLRGMVVEASTEPKSSPTVVEIGTLFGVGYTAIATQLRIRGVNPYGILIDPLDGYYGESTDRTGERVSESVLRENLALAGLVDSDVTIIKDLSQSATARGFVEDREGGVSTLIVDGDHTEHGAARDLASYSPLVRVGGYVIVDDYGTPEWPGVTAAADRFLAANPQFIKLGAMSRTAVLQRNN